MPPITPLRTFLGRDVSGVKTGGTKGIVNVVGLGATLTAMSMVSKRAQKGLKKGMVEEAKHVLDDAKKIVPIDTGALNDSARVDDPVERNGKIWVAFGFGPALAERKRRGGSSGSEYALPVHEIKKAYKRGREKYLEIPWMLHQDHAMDRIANIAWKNF